MKNILIVFFTAQALLLAEPDFEKDVAPILESRCLSCHNPHKKKGKFDLSQRLSMLKHKNAVIPGKPAASVLLESISGDDPDMPSKGEPLSKEQIAILQNWIAAGAKWPAERILEDNPNVNRDWWSLKPIVKPPFSIIFESLPSLLKYSFLPELNILT